MANTKILDSVRNEPLWQDRDIRFDSQLRDLSLRKGEVIVEQFDRVEDTKGNSGDEGRLTISNLRMMWQSRAKPRINLSVGLSCVTSISNRTLHNKVITARMSPNLLINIFFIASRKIRCFTYNDKNNWHSIRVHLHSV